MSSHRSIYQQNDIKTILLKERQLVAYRVVYWSELVPLSMERIYTVLHPDTGAIELRGEAPLASIAAVFVRLCAVATEITYRSAVTEPAYVLFSMLDEERYMRPTDVCVPPAPMRRSVYMAAKELSSLTLDDLWVAEREYSQEEQLRELVGTLRGYRPSKHITISGTLPLLPFLVILGWVAMQGGTYTYS